MSSKTNHNFPSRKINRQSFQKEERKEKTTCKYNFYKNLTERKIIYHKKGLFDDFYNDDVDYVDTYEIKETMT